MVIKLNISQKGKAFRLEIEPIVLDGKSLGDKIEGKEIKPELDGYEFEITGGSDTSGFPMSKNIEGIALKKVLLKRGWGMHEKHEGLRKRKTVRGKVVTEKIALLNLNTVKEGNKSLVEIFPSSPSTEKSEKQPSAEEKIEENE